MAILIHKIILLKIIKIFKFIYINIINIFNKKIKFLLNKTNFFFKEWLSVFRNFFEIPL